MFIWGGPLGSHGLDLQPTWPFFLSNRIQKLVMAVGSTAETEDLLMLSTPRCPNAPKKHQAEGHMCCRCWWQHVTCDMCLFSVQDM